MRTLALLLQLVAAAASPETRARKVQSEDAVPIVILKEARTGSTWMADMLRREPVVGFFEHEATDCLKKLGPLAQWRAMYSMLAAPTCDMACGAYPDLVAELGKGKTLDEVGSKRRPAWLRWKPSRAPECLWHRVVGFDAQPSHVFRDSGSGDKWHPDVKGTKRVGGGNITVLDWKEHWAPLLRLPRVQTVVYARSNAVKMYVSKRHGRVLGDLCGGHKVIGGSARHEAQRLCFERNREKLDAPLKLGAHELVAEAHRIGRNWASLLEDARAASGRERFPIFFYEALQRDAAEELGRLFRVIKLSAPGLKLPHHDGPGPASTSVKVTRDDLSQGVLRDFPKLARDLAKLDPCLAPQLHDRAYATFPELCGTRASFADYDVAPTPACNSSRAGRAPWVVFTQQRSGSRWFVDRAGERSGVEPTLSLRVRELSLRPGTYGHRPELDVCDAASAACDCAVRKLFDEQRRLRPDKDWAPGFKYMWWPSEIGNGTSRLDGLLRGLCALEARVVVYERRNVLRRFISAASNNVDRGAAPGGEGHVHKMAHPRDQEAAARVRSFRPTLDAATLKDRIAAEVAAQFRLVDLLERSCEAWDVAPRVHYYEDLVDANPKSAEEWGVVLHQLGAYDTADVSKILRGFGGAWPVDPKGSVVLHGARPVLDTVANPAEVEAALRGTPFEWMLEG